MQLTDRTSPSGEVTTMNNETRARVVEHGEKLKQLFNLRVETDPLLLCGQLRRLETRMHKVNEAYCNGYTVDSRGNQKPFTFEQHDAVERDVLAKVDKLLFFKAQNIVVFVNSDPRGYALKISDSHKAILRSMGFAMDWGDYGLLAPDLTGDSFYYHAGEVTP